MKNPMQAPLYPTSVRPPSAYIKDCSFSVAILLAMKDGTALQGRTFISSDGKLVWSGGSLTCNEFPTINQDDIKGWVPFPSAEAIARNFHDLEWNPMNVLPPEKTEKPTCGVSVALLYSLTDHSKHFGTTYFSPTEGKVQLAMVKMLESLAGAANKLNPPLKWAVMPTPEALLEMFTCD